MRKVWLLYGDADAPAYDGGPTLLSVHATREHAEKEWAKLARAYRRAMRKIDAPIATDLNATETRAYYASGDFKIEAVPVRGSKEAGDA